MLDDRYYMRRPGYGLGRSVTMMLLIVNLAVFILQMAAERWFGFPFTHVFALSLSGLGQGMIWQPISFQFLHAGWLHLLVNCWAIFVFGRELEQTLGIRKYLWLYFLSGVFGGLLQLTAALLLPQHFGGAVVGASAGVFGLIAAYASLFPERQLTLLLFFIIPVSMRAKFLLLFSGIIAVLGVLFPGDHIAHAAHLGGMIMGIMFVRYVTQGGWEWPSRESRASRPMVRVHSPPGVKAGGKRDTFSEDFLSKEVDPILDKISAHGIQSLTERERQILETARKKMGRS
jgi:membrane associated rhomboid family serine protease